MVRNGRAGEEFMGDKHDKPFHVIQLDNGGYVVVAAMTQRWTENFLPPKEMVIDVFDDEPQPFVAMTERLPNGEKGRRFLNMNILHVRPPG
jgi:hypothetical protein